MNRKKILIGISLVAVIALGIFGFSRDEKNFEVAKNLDIYYTLFRELNLFYVDDVNPNKLVNFYE